MSEVLTMTCDVAFAEAAVEAAGGDTPKQPTVHMVAYTGAAIRQAGWRFPVVIDLAGLDISKQNRPLRFAHEPTTGGVGHTTRIYVEAGQLIAEGVVSRGTEAAREVVASSKAGFPWQASIGATPVETAVVKAGDKATVNGREFSGPLHLVRKAVLTEISFVDLGADDNTSAAIAASHSEDETMADEKEVVDGGKAEQKHEPGVKAAAKPGLTLSVQERAAAHKVEAGRRDQITAIADRFMGNCPERIDDIAAAAEQWIDEKRDVPSFENYCLVHFKNSTRMQPPVSAKADISAATYEAALCQTLRLDGVEAAYGEQVLEAAHRRWKGTLGLHELFLEAGHANGFRGHSLASDGALKACLKAALGEGDIRAAGFSTIDVTGILSNVANKFVATSFDAVEQSWRPICKTRPVKDFKTVSGYAMGSAGVDEEVGPGGELKHASLSETEYTNRARTYGSIIALNRQDLINDDLGMLQSVAAKLGRRSALGFNKVFWTEFLADNSTFYTTGRGNYTTGSGTALASSSLEAIDVLFHALTDPDGNPMGVMPRFLVVPHNLKVAALELVSSGNINTGGAASTTKVPNRNVWAGMFDVVVSTYLNSSAIAGGSSTAWFLLASPMDVPVIEAVFLNGNERPTVESGEVDFSTLGMQWRCYFDYGVKKQEYRGGVKSKGAA